MTYYLCPPNKSSDPTEKIIMLMEEFWVKQGEPPAVELKSFRLVPFICNIFTLVLMAGGAVRQGAASPTANGAVELATVVVTETVTWCRYAAPQSADHSIEILSQVNE